MKTINAIILFTMAASLSWAADLPSEDAPADWESYHVIDRLLTIQKPGAPVIYEDYVIFTASSSLRRVGVAFAHENFSRVYWFRQLLASQDPIGAPIPPGKKFPDPYKDSGIQFHVYQVPEEVKELEYRLVVSGLWIVDPSNPQTRKDPVSGLIWSVLTLPPRTPSPNPLRGLPRGLDFSFRGAPGETVTIAGDFNGWDPFMYELTEYPAGVYSINIPLLPGAHQYVFFYRGQRFADPNNPRRVYARDGSAASEIIVP